MGRTTLLLVAVVLGLTLSSSDVETCIHPNIPDFYFNASFRADAVMETVLGVDIFSVSPQCNCNSTVTAIQYCYRASSPRNNRHDVFEFLFVTRNDSVFTINKNFTVQAVLQESTCNPIQMQPPNKRCDCCDTYRVPLEEQFQIPSAFGIRTTNTDRKLLTIPSSDANLYVEQFTTTENKTSGRVEFLPSNQGQVGTPAILLLRYVTSEYHVIWLKIFLSLSN